MISQSKVFKAVYKTTGQQVAIKIMEKKRMNQSYKHEFARNELALHHSLSNFTRCPNIVRVLDYFEDNEKYYLVMELCEDPNFFEDRLEDVCLFLNLPFKVFLPLLKIIIKLFSYFT
jgi:calcium-dependent protein kinase